MPSVFPADSLSSLRVAIMRLPTSTAAQQTQQPPSVFRPNSASSRSGCRADSHPPSPFDGVSEDLLTHILSLLDLPSLATCLCVSTEWNQAARDPLLWVDVEVPRGKAHLVWDAELASILQHCAPGSLRSLDVSWSGITGKSLRRLFHTRVLAPEVDLLALDHCCNLRASDVVTFMRNVTQQQQQQDEAHAHPTRHQSRRSSGGRVSDLAAFEAFLRDGSVAADPTASDFDFASFRSTHASVKRAMEAEAVSSHIRSLHVDGCKRTTAADVATLSQLSDWLDVATCACGRVACLLHCHRPSCSGLCSFCVDVLDGCDVDCGSCVVPTNHRQAMRAHMRGLSHMLRGGEAVRLTWTDVRYGMVTVGM